ncbi:MAG TPA: hypothetical protein VEC35_25570 [Noviherbaspirillum sp.]|nr:hypothetical protein [Noviherbaspirillum sp.]
MENPVSAVPQVAKVDVAPGMGGVDPAKVAEFERLMSSGTAGSNGIAQYQIRTEPSTSGWTSDILRMGAEISRDYRKERVQVHRRIVSLDPTDPITALRQTFMIQAGTQAQIYRLQLATSVVESINRGFSTLFQLQG